MPGPVRANAHLMAFDRTVTLDVLLIALLYRYLARSDTGNHGGKMHKHAGAY